MLTVAVLISGGGSNLRALLEAAADPAAREALDHFFGTTRFIALDPRNEAGLDYLRRAVARVVEEVE